jgi:exodeoxyribonuclease VII small subunit
VREERRTVTETRTPAVDVSTLSFEAALQQLEQIVDQLERGQVPLEESISIYEKGQLLRRHCEALLKRAEMRVEKIQLSADGEPVGTEPLDGD